MHLYIMNALDLQQQKKIQIDSIPIYTSGCFTEFLPKKFVKTKFRTLFTFWSAVCLHFQNLAAAAAAGGIGVRPSFATGMAGIPHAATGLSLQAAIANQAAYGQALPAT